MSGFDPVVQRRLDNLAEELVADYAGKVEPQAIRDLMTDSAARLAESAVFPDFLPPLAFRLTKERLSASGRTEQERVDGAYDVVFVSLGGGGRGQIAAALTTLLSGSRVVAHSAGTTLRGEIDPAVSAAIGELGIDVADAFARPVTPEVLKAANMVVTMGHSVGTFDIPEEVRHEDWRVGDPVGAPMEEVRRVRDDIERRVRELLDSLGVESVPSGVTAPPG